MMPRSFIAANSCTVHPGNVHVIDLTKMQRCGGLGLFDRQFDRLSEPDNTIEFRQFDGVKVTGQIHGFPFAMVKCRLSVHFIL